MPDESSSAYPVVVRGHRDEDLERWRWLYKWFLAIPHFVVLIALWVASVVLTVIAGASIALNGTYPRGIFDFNVGVMRWTWRVQFYAFALGTDSYPPFSLSADPSYPADLDVEYQQRLSRSKVWVKWWLLAIPHYAIVALFVGGAVPNFRLAGGLTVVLAIVAGVHVALRRGYPDSIFDLVMGMYRWSWRVAAYAGLMRDEYPPFRIDMGPDEPPSPPVLASDN